MSTADKCGWVATRLKIARDSGDLVTELALQIRLDQLLDRLHREQSAEPKDDRHGPCPA